MKGIIHGELEVNIPAGAMVVNLEDYYTLKRELEMLKSLMRNKAFYIIQHGHIASFGNSSEEMRRHIEKYISYYKESMALQNYFGREDYFKVKAILAEADTEHSLKIVPKLKKKKLWPFK